MVEEDEEGFAKMVKHTPLWANITFFLNFKNIICFSLFFFSLVVFSDAKICLNGLVLIAIFEKRQEIQERIQSHYTDLARRQFLQVPLFLHSTILFLH